MVKVRKDLTGQKFGRLTVLYQTEDYVSPKGIHYAQYHCICNCDKHNEVDVLASHLQGHKVKSCGCLYKESNKRYNTFDLTTQQYGIGYTTNGQEFYFDLEDYDLIKDYMWYIDKARYVVI